MEKETIKHPAFGQISFGRTQGHANFYGSELDQGHYITMELRSSEMSRDLTRDWYYAHNSPIAKVRMTANQFSELITSMNMGGGVPCTIEMIDGKTVEKLPDIENKKEFTHRKFKGRMKIFAASLKSKQEEVKRMTAKKTLTKEDQVQLNQHIEWLTQEITKNIPFFMECFQETMDAVVLDAKSEVENAIQHKINVLGLKELHKQNKLIDDGK